MEDVKPFELMKELTQFMENEKDKYPNLIKFLEKQFAKAFKNKMS